MRNVMTKVDKGVLTITVDLNSSGEVSASGKSMVVATTEGNVTISGTDVKLGLNIYRKNPKYNAGGVAGAPKDLVDKELSITR